MSATIDALEDLGACQPALNWCKDQPRQGAEALWRACDNFAWLAWIIGLAYPTSGGEFNSMLREARVAHGDALAAANRPYDDAIDRAARAYDDVTNAARLVRQDALDSAADALGVAQAPLEPAKVSARTAARAAYDVRLEIVDAAYRAAEFPSDEAYHTACDAAYAVFRAAYGAAEEEYYATYDKCQNEYRLAHGAAWEEYRLAHGAAEDAYDAVIEEAGVARDLALRGAHKTYCDAIRSVFKRPTIHQLLKVAAERIDNDIPF
jgi:hypothetical protein